MKYESVGAHEIIRVLTNYTESISYVDVMREGGNLTLGEYQGIERAKEVLRELVETAGQGGAAFIMPEE